VLIYPLQSVNSVSPIGLTQWWSIVLQSGLLRFYRRQCLHVNKLRCWCTSSRWAGIAQSVQLLATGWTVRGSISGGGEIFRPRPYRSWDPPSFIWNGYWVSFPGIKRPERGVDHLPPPSAEVKETVEPYLYSQSGPSCSVLGWNLPLPYPSSVTYNVLIQVIPIYFNPIITV